MGVAVATNVVRAVESTPVIGLRPDPLASAVPVRSWSARLALEFTRMGAETVLTKRQHEGPLRVQRPFRESHGPCQAYVLHPPGGIVGGDTLELSAQVRRYANGLLTTPGAAKFYRSNGTLAQQQQRFAVEERASLEWLPQETILFDGAVGRSATHIDLMPNARVIAWEVTCLGRPACLERFTTGAWQQRFTLCQNGEPLLSERVHCKGNDPALTAAWGFQGSPVFGTLVVHPVADTALELVRETAFSITNSLPDHRFGATLLKQTEQASTLVCRYLGASTEQCKALFTSLWQQLRPQVVGLEAEIPRVWRT